MWLGSIFPQNNLLSKILFRIALILSVKFGRTWEHGVFLSIKMEYFFNYLVFLDVFLESFAILFICFAHVLPDLYLSIFHDLGFSVMVIVALKNDLGSFAFASYLLKKTWELLMFFLNMSLNSRINFNFFNKYRTTQTIYFLFWEYGNLCLSRHWFILCSLSNLWVQSS